MNPKFEQFKYVVRDYPEFKVQFKLFCDKSATIINNNPHLQGTSFSVDGGGTTAELRFLDQTFDLRFHLLAQNEVRFGVIRIYYSSSMSEEILLSRTFFNIYGNVIDTPDSPRALYSLWDTEFIIKLIGDFTEQYFSNQFETLNLSDIANTKQVES